MGKSGVNWHKVYYAFIAVHVLIGLINNDDFRLWLIRFSVATLLLATIMAFDR